MYTIIIVPTKLLKKLITQVYTRLNHLALTLSYTILPREGSPVKIVGDNVDEEGST